MRGLSTAPDGNVKGIVFAGRRAQGDRLEVRSIQTIIRWVTHTPGFDRGQMRMSPGRITIFPRFNVVPGAWGTAERSPLCPSTAIPRACPLSAEGRLVIVTLSGGDVGNLSPRCLSYRPHRMRLGCGSTDTRLVNLGIEGGVNPA